MIEHLTYSALSDEDKLLMDDLFKYKAGKDSERKIIRDILAQLKKCEMECTKEIMNLSVKAIGEKFDLGETSAKPLTKKNRENIKDRISKKKSGVSGLSLKKQQQIISRIKGNKILSEKNPSKFNCENNTGTYILSTGRIAK